jgi:hypothetical protein
MEIADRHDPAASGSSTSTCCSMRKGATPSAGTVPFAPFALTESSESTRPASSPGRHPAASKSADLTSVNCDLTSVNWSPRGASWGTG